MRSAVNDDALDFEVVGKSLSRARREACAEK